MYLISHERLSVDSECEGNCTQHDTVESDILFYECATRSLEEYLYELYHSRTRKLEGFLFGPCALLDRGFAVLYF